MIKSLTHFSIFPFFNCIAFPDESDVISLSAFTDPCPISIWIHIEIYRFYAKYHRISSQYSNMPNNLTFIAFTLFTIRYCTFYWWFLQLVFGIYIFLLGFIKRWCLSINDVHTMNMKRNQTQILSKLNTQHWHCLFDEQFQFTGLLF